VDSCLFQKEPDSISDTHYGVSAFLFWRPHDGFGLSSPRCIHCSDQGSTHSFGSTLRPLLIVLAVQDIIGGWIPHYVLCSLYLLCKT